MPTSETGNRVTQPSRSQGGFEPVRRYAEHGFTPVRRYAEHGFTLVELMVVLVIIGLASAAVVLMMPDPRGRVRDEAERFAARALAVRDDAIVQGRDSSIVVTAAGYSVERRAHGRWEAARDRPFGPVAWSEGTGIALGDAGRARATFDSTGAIGDPVTFDLERGGARALVTIAGDGAIRVAG